MAWSVATDIIIVYWRSEHFSVYTELSHIEG